jgi:hypothetical protein
MQREFFSNWPRTEMSLKLLESPNYSGYGESAYEREESCRESHVTKLAAESYPSRAGLMPNKRHVFANLFLLIQYSFLLRLTANRTPKESE